MQPREATADHIETLDLLWGIETIAKTLGLTKRQAQYKLEQGALPAKKVGGRWVADRSRLREFFQQVAA